MDLFSNTTAAAIEAGILFTIIGAWIKDRVEEFTRRHDRADARDEKQADEQHTQAVDLAAAEARIDAVEGAQNRLESAVGALANAVERLARLEEWRMLAAPKIDEAELTARAVVGIGEQVKTLFARIDDMDKAMPGRIVTELKAQFRQPAAAQTKVA